MKRGDGPVDPLTPTQADVDTAGGTQPRTEGGAFTTTNYKLGEVIGRGGMGEVLLAHDARIGRDVALKRMRSGEPTVELVERFLREAKIQARLDHPAIVPVHELGYDAAGRPYFTMKRVTGTTLATLLDDGTETQQRLLRALVDVCLAVELAHSRQVVHRDLKPSNIMLGDFGEVYVLDWGVARVLVDPGEPRAAIADVRSLDGETKAGALLGTPGYMAPEQARGEDVGTPADVYALGSILFEILAREPLHPRGHSALASTLTLAEMSPARRGGERSIAPELDLVAVDALAADPAARPTARQLADRIQNYLDGDRDVERRRAVAVEKLAAARDALASGDPSRRAEAVHLAGHALAFDPRSTDAADLVTSLIIEPPAVMPPELAASVTSLETQSARDRSRRAILPYLCFYLWTFFLPWAEIASWPNLVMLYGAVTCVLAVSFVNWKVKSVPVGLLLFSQLGLCVAFSRLNSPFVLTPMLITGLLLATTSQPWLGDRRWAVIGWTVLAVMAPMILEALGVFAQTWKVTTSGLVAWGTIIKAGSAGGELSLVIANLAFALVLALYAHAVNRDRRDAQRRLHVQAWHLEQLLPRRKSQRLLGG